MPPKNNILEHNAAVLGNRSIERLNRIYQKLLSKVDNSVWQDYELIGTQWFWDPSSPSPLLTHLANSLNETFIRQASSCHVCHPRAKTVAGKPADFSFLLRAVESLTTENSSTQKLAKILK
ncbi:MAG: hypothetical protein AAGG02_03630 [Cyanobacteria bacterium P01_H01_bin.15]